MIERRKFIRIPRSTKISYKISNSPKIKSSVTRNISQGGISFLADEFIPKGTILKLEFALEEFTYDDFAKVIWVMEEAAGNQYEVGAEFMTIPKVA